MRAGRSPALLLALLCLAGCSQRAAAQPDPGPVAVTAQPVAMDPTAPEKSAAGAFTYAGGVVLKGPEGVRFGGLSDLRVEGGELTAVSDEGFLFRSHLVLSRNGRLIGLNASSLQPLTGPDGAPLKGKAEADSEGLAIWPNGEVMVSFERHHRIWRYPAAGGAPREEPIPDLKMPDNEGIEGLTVAKSQGPGAYWAGAEGGSVWLCRESASCRRWPGIMAPPIGYRLTALSETPGGDLVLLHHNFNPLNGESRVLATIVAIPKARFAASKIKAQLRIVPPMSVDNLEGVSAVRTIGGGLRLYLVSDDNFSDRQRTLLLAFDLPPAKRR